MATGLEKAVFAGGCFWCMQAEFSVVPGVTHVVSGYTGGHTQNPTYERVSLGNTGHVEAIEVTYDPAKVSYKNLLDIFWRNVDPLDARGQFCDKGSQYLAGIFVANDAEKIAAEASKTAIERKLGQKVATLIVPTSVFYPAEDYHQDFHIKNSNRYKSYRAGCGRDERLQHLQQKMSQP
ncbi:MAG: peptide-methionine (S)-S-oxide reductase MsrA [Holosporales bacterium]|jgi:peptide-methionine (S)-S-oxide reductase